jgi:hypothetical protein
LGFTLFPREYFHVVRIEKLKLLYAMIKKKKVSAIKLMMHYWLTIPRLKGDVWCTSWVTRLARNLGLLANDTITYITTPRWIIDYVYFNKAHRLKRGKDGKTMIMYKDYINEFEMLDQNLGLYVVEPRRSASTKFTHNSNSRYRDEDTASAGLAFTSYTGFDQAGPSMIHHLGHDGWEQPAPHHSEASWQQGSSAQWEHGNFDYYQQQEYEEISSNI